MVGGGGGVGGKKSRNLLNRHFASTFMIMPQPESLRSNGVDRRIQRTKQVRNTIERSSDCSGGGGGGRGENSRDEQIYRRRL